MLKVGGRVPVLHLGRLRHGVLEAVNLHDHLADHLALIVGVPGAFTPVCTAEHIPSFIAQAPALKKAGFTRVICVAGNDPWVTAAWAASLDPEGKIEFLADGNYNLARSLDALCSARDLFMGERPTRYLMISRDGVVERLRIEASPTALTCTRPADVFI